MRSPSCSHAARPRVLGVGAAGMVDCAGVIHYSPNVPAFLEAPVRERLETTLGMPVVVDNDANVAALRRDRARRREHVRDALVITLGTGVGGGIVTDGRAARRARLRRRDRPLPGRPGRPALRAGSPVTGRPCRRATALGALGRARAEVGLRRRCSSTPVAASARSRRTWARPRWQEQPTRS